MKPLTAGACCLALLSALAPAQSDSMLIPGSPMLVAGTPDAKQRDDPVVSLHAISAENAAAAASAELPDLKQADAKHRVTAIRYCGGGYFVSTAARDDLRFREFNLRFRTDSSKHGPAAGQPVLVPQGMAGDRAQIVFAKPAEISAFIRNRCGGKGRPPISTDPR